ncbi:MAG TPA: DUF2461 family protein [Candidatus Acidoferrales bacterium]|nr:DUF2461 family protein [Candidatus Acidoferrales bacterium]
MGNAAKSSKKSPLTKETFRFFAQLARNNRKEWMDANRERYQECVVAPMRALLEALSPAIRELDDALVITGRTNENFSRINRDIRFAKDKTPYHTRIYLKVPDSTDGEGAELYVGVNREVVTAGFRIYGGSKIKESPLFKVGIQRALANPEWVARQKKRLGKKYESYWHSMERGDWTKNAGWPSGADEWSGARAWIVRRTMKPSEAMRPGFVNEVTRIFRNVYPLAKFASGKNWRAR